MPAYELIFFPESGASGDMLVAALVDLLNCQAEFLKFVDSLRLKARTILQKVQRCNLSALQLQVECTENEELEHYEQISNFIQRLPVEEKIKEHSLQVIQRIFAAEAKVHQLPLEHTHLHEISADDTLIDIIGFCWLWSKLDFCPIFFSPPVCGRGTVQTAHGILPIPAPATLELLKGTSFVTGSTEVELLTPTGAALLTTFGKHLPEEKEICPLQIGYGAGKLDLENRPNVLRAILSRANKQTENLILLQTQFDDISGEKAAFLATELRMAGAIEVFWQNILMKKERPGFLLNVLTPTDQETEIVRLIFENSPTIGIRRSRQQRWVLPRSEHEIDYNGFKIRYKVATFNGKTVNVKIDFQSIVDYAREKKISIKEAEKQLGSFINERI